MKIVQSPVYLLAAFCLFVTLVIFSCKKEVSQSLSPQDEQQANITASESDAEAEDVFNGVFDDVMGVNSNVGIGGTGLFTRNTPTSYGIAGSDQKADNIDPAPACLNVIVATNTNSGGPFPITVTLDFGGSCAGPDNHVRRGKIVVTYSDRLLYPNATAVLQFKDFYIDSIYIDNSTKFTIANTGTQDKAQFTIDISAKLGKPNGNYTEWVSHKVITRTDGGSTSTPADDVMQVEGAASGNVKTNSLAVAWKAQISDPLIKRFICRWISQGAVKIGRENLSSSSQWIGTLDYGTGNCDDRATLTLNGMSYQITLH